MPLPGPAGGQARALRRGATLLLVTLLLLASPLAASGSSPARGDGAGPAATPLTGLAGDRSSIGPSPHAVTLPWSGGLSYAGFNTTGTELFLANVTIPAGIPDATGYNYTVGVGAADLSCTWGAAVLDNSAGIWRFEYTFTARGSSGPSLQGFSPRADHLTPGDTYQLFLQSHGGNFVASVYNVSAGVFYSSAAMAPIAQGSYGDGASGLLTGPSLCLPSTVSLQANLTVTALPGGSSAPSRDLFVQNESLALSASPYALFAEPNLWSPYRHEAPSGFAPAQSWATSDLISLTTTHGAIAFATTTAPPANVDVGQAVSVGVVGTPSISPVAANANSLEFTQVEFSGYPGTSSLSFATCASTNASNSNHGYPGGSTAPPGEYGYTSNSSVSDIYLAFERQPAVNFSADDRCYTGALSTPGNLTIEALAYLEYPGTAPTVTFVDALTSGPREQLGMNAMSWNVWVHPLPTINATSSGSVLLVNQVALFTAQETGGDPALCYVWYVDAVPQGGCGLTSFADSWASPGTHQVWVAVVDGSGNRAVSSHLNETIDPALTASIAPYPNAAGSVGTPLLCAATAGGGAPGYGYDFWVNGSVAPVQRGPHGGFGFTEAHPGTYQVWVSLNDSVGNWAASPHVNITEAFGVVASVTPANATAEAGVADATLTAAASGGTGSYTFVWQTPGLTPQGACSITCVVGAAAPGNYSAWVVATDGAGRTAVSAHANVTVVAKPAFLAWVGPRTIDRGANDTFDAVFAGGASPFTYAWSVNGTPVAPYCSSSPICALTLPSPGPETIEVGLTDTFGSTVLSAPLAVLESVPLSVTLAPPVPSAGEVGLATTLSAVASNGAGGNTYGFLTSSAPGTPFGVGPLASAAWTPAAVGLVQVWAEANDSSGFRAVSPHANVTVAAPLAISITPSPSATVEAGGVLNVSAAATGGSGTVVFSWYADGTAAPGCLGAYCIYQWPSLGPHQVWASGMDGLGAVAASPHTNVTVVQGVSAAVTFLIAPSQGGTLSVDGTPTSSGNISKLLPGSYALVASAVPGYTFAGWNLSSPTSLSVGDPAAPATTLQFAGGSGGIVVAEFRGTVPLTVLIAVSPTGSGLVSINGTAFGGGASATLVAGAYALDAAPAAGFEFLSWVGIAGVSVVQDMPTTLLVLGANGTITLDTTASTITAPFTVALSVLPSGAGGTIQIGAVPYQSGASPGVAAGTYALLMVPPSGYTFGSWQVSGGATVEGPSQAATNLTVSGNASLTAVLVKSGPSGLLGLSTQSFEILLLLVIALLVLVVIGAVRHRAHAEAAARQARANPSPPAWDREDGTAAPFEGDDPPWSG